LNSALDEHLLMLWKILFLSWVELRVIVIKEETAKKETKEDHSNNEDCQGMDLKNLTTINSHVLVLNQNSEAYIKDLVEGNI